MGCACMCTRVHMSENMHCMDRCVRACTQSSSPGDLIVLVKYVSALDLFRMGFSIRQCVQAEIRALPSCAPAGVGAPRTFTAQGWLVPSSWEVFW